MLYYGAVIGLTMLVAAVASGVVLRNRLGQVHELAEGTYNGCSPYRLYSGPIIFCSCSLSSSWELGLSGYPRGLGSDFGG